MGGGRSFQGVQKAAWKREVGLRAAVIIMEGKEKGICKQLNAKGDA